MSLSLSSEDQQRREPCPECKGSGSVHSPSPEDYGISFECEACEACRGSGHVLTVADLREDMDLAVEALCFLQCPAYRGDGVCQSGCSQEPACQVDEPSEGWLQSAINLLAEGHR